MNHYNKRETDYPSTMYASSLKEYITANHQKIDELCQSADWTKVFEFLDIHPYLINCCRLPVQGETTASLNTPLHYAASKDAPKDVIKKMLNYGAAKSLKNADGKNAYDIGVSLNIEDKKLVLLQLPDVITRNADTIQVMEEALHGVINGRVEELIKEHGMFLPQLSFFFEMGQFYYSVPGMYGGFRVKPHKKGIEVFSFIRICGGSEQVHVIERNGKVTFRKIPYYM